MISEKTLKKIEFDKILNSLKDYAVLERTKSAINDMMPSADFSDAVYQLKKTEEAYRLLYFHSAVQIFFFDDVSEILDRVDKGGVIDPAEILKVSANLKSARILKGDVLKFDDPAISIIPQIAKSLYINKAFEDEVASKIISETEISDKASEKLYSIRKSIRNLNASIRDKLNSYIRGNSNKFLQDSVVTVRGDRYVIPVKSEYRSSVRGFIHDQSDSGATVFIEPEQVMELNNELKRAMIEEKNEIYRILSDLSSKITSFSSAVRYNSENISDIDMAYAKATYSFTNKCTKPNLNNEFFIDIKRGRHPLIDSSVVVPVDVSLGKNYNLLLITGPNTGGKTVTLKLVGLLTAMALSGFYVPCVEDSSFSFFSQIFCDIGDEQSIEQNLSTFSSHILSIKNILENADHKTLVLIDEIGAGTDPDDGSAIALAVIKKLLSIGSFGIITTHYSKLKAFASETDKIENASMEFDINTLRPLYKLNVGIPGSSNAIEICKVLGLGADIISDAMLFISDKAVNFENVLKRAEEERRRYESLSLEVENLKKLCEAELEKAKEERAKIEGKREEIFKNAKAETKRIVEDKLSDAEEIIDELKQILKNAELESKEVFKAGELKKRLENIRYNYEDSNDDLRVLTPVGRNNLKPNSQVFVKKLNSLATLLSVNNKNEATVLIGTAKSVVPVSELYKADVPTKKSEKSVSVKRSSVGGVPLTEINVIGKTSAEALLEIENFISQAVYFNLNEVKIIHGIGTGVLIKTVREYLKKCKYVKDFRKGVYGEGENGVTIVTLK